MAKIEILGIPHSYELTSPARDPKAPILIFIHGWLLSRQYWRPLINLLAPHYQCLTYDLRGFGDSQGLTLAQAKAENDYNLAAYARDLQILIEQLEMKHVWLIGHSLGGSIALWGASLYPNAIEGVICLNSGGGIYLKEEFERFRYAGKQIIKYRPSWLFYVPLIDLLFSRAMVANPLPLDWGRQRVKDFLKADKEAAIGALLETTTKDEVHLLPQIVAQIEQPAYFLAGDKDKVMETKYVRHLASFHHLFSHQDSNVIELANCGHLSMLEQVKLVKENITQILTKYGMQKAIH